MFSQVWSHCSVCKAVFTQGPVLFRILANRTRREHRVCIHTTNDWPDANGTRPLRREHTASASRPVLTQLHVLNSWHMSPFRVMWIVSVEINRSVSRHGETVRRSLPDASDASTRAFTLQSQANANRSRPLRTHPDVDWVYRTDPTQWTQCVHGQPDANRSRTVCASGKIVSVYTGSRCLYFPVCVWFWFLPWGISVAVYLLYLKYVVQQFWWHAISHNYVN